MPPEARAFWQEAEPSNGGGGQSCLRAQLFVPSSLRTQVATAQRRGGDGSPVPPNRCPATSPRVGRACLPGPAADTRQGPENLEVPPSAQGAAVLKAVCVQSDGVRSQEEWHTLGWGHSAIATGGHHLMSESSEGTRRQQEKDSTFCLCRRRKERHGLRSGSECDCHAAGPAVQGRGVPCSSGGAAGVQEEGFLREDGLFSGQPDARERANSTSANCSGGRVLSRCPGRAPATEHGTSSMCPGGHQLLHTVGGKGARHFKTGEREPTYSKLQ